MGGSLWAGLKFILLLLKIPDELGRARVFERVFRRSLVEDVSVSSMAAQTAGMTEEDLDEFEASARIYATRRLRYVIILIVVF